MRLDNPGIVNEQMRKKYCESHKKRAHNMTNHAIYSVWLHFGPAELMPLLGVVLKVCAAFGLVVEKPIQGEFQIKAIWQKDWWPLL